MANAKFSSGFYRKMELVITPSVRNAMAQLSKKSAHWGIKDQGDLPMIMGVLEFGDPGHTFLNTKKGSRTRKELELNAAFRGEDNPSEIPPRPWLRRSILGEYRKELAKYINKNLPRVLEYAPKRGKQATLITTQRRMSLEDFYKGLAETGKENAIMSWEKANFEPNAKATLANKDDDRPLHGNGKGEHPMSESAITAWSE